MMEKFRQQVMEKNVYELSEWLLSESGIINDVSQDTAPETISRKENLQELLSGMNEFVNGRLEEGNEAVFLTDYLSEISLLTDQDEEKNAEGDRITLMTIHSAKGLEFRNVFVVGLEEDIFPSSYSLDSQRALEEERRLLYVAMTRAEKVCVLSYAKSRFRNGQINFTKPSRFIADLDPVFLEFPPDASLLSSTSQKPDRFTDRDTSRKPVFRGSSPVSANSGKPLVKLPATPKQASASLQATAQYNSLHLSIGQYILHERFGKGEIVGIEGNGPNCTINVQFDHSGNRKLLLKFARFTLVD
jgi:DNA helicase-2/ATP-dependent DNA helicase PcrA